MHSILHLIDKEPQTYTLDDELIRVRPIQPEDRDALAEHHRSLSSESRYMRFLATKPALSERELDEFTNVDHTSREALIVYTLDDNGRERHVIGVVRYNTLDGTAIADFACVVLDKYQRNGICRVILDALITQAKSNGLKEIYGEIHINNSKMINLVLSFGFTVTKDFSDGLAYAHLKLE